MTQDIEAVVEKAVEEAFKEFDGLYMGWFTPDELDLVLEALLQYGQNDPNKAKQVFDLLKAMTELKEEGVKNDPA